MNETFFNQEKGRNGLFSERTEVVWILFPSFLLSFAEHIVKIHRFLRRVWIINVVLCFHFIPEGSAFLGFFFSQSISSFSVLDNQKFQSSFERWNKALFSDSYCSFFKTLQTLLYWLIGIYPRDLSKLQIYLGHNLGTAILSHLC